MWLDLDYNMLLWYGDYVLSKARVKLVLYVKKMSFCFLCFCNVVTYGHNGRYDFNASSGKGDIRDQLARKARLREDSIGVIPNLSTKEHILSSSELCHNAPSTAAQNTWNILNIHTQSVSSNAKSYVYSIQFTCACQLVLLLINGRT